MPLSTAPRSSPVPSLTHVTSQVGFLETHGQKDHRRDAVLLFRCAQRLNNEICSVLDASPVVPRHVRVEMEKGHEQKLCWCHRVGHYTSPR
jgi:hypothetical protein